MERTTESAGPNCAVAALEVTAAIQIKLVNDHTALHIGDADMEGEDGVANSERPQEETCARTAPVDYIKLAINEPTERSCLVWFKHARRRNFFQLLFKILSEFDRRERLANGVLALGLRLITREFSGIHAERTNVNRPWTIGAHAAIGGDHAHV